MNQKNAERGSAGINCLWQIRENQIFKEALEKAKAGEGSNNISPIHTYSVGKTKFMWLDDIKTDFLKVLRTK